MEKKKKITQYRERLDKTLASPDLTNQESINSLVSNQIHLSNLRHGTEGCNDNVVLRRTAEVSNFLDMLRSASSNDNASSRASETGHSEWKMKQDDEEFRVMYREGPKGTPYHTLLVEGFVDGPVDICKFTSFLFPLFSLRWPQFTLPSFKILTSKCLQKVRIGEQIALVRVKVSWPLSTREIVVHYFLFEYFQDDLIVILLNSISDLDSIDVTTHGFTRHAIPDADDVVRIDVVGGFAIQKVTDNRSYFRTIANMDMKLDFVPPSLINFVSRQLIGSGFRLYQKVVASFKSDEDFMKALKDPLYTRINEALYQRNRKEKVFEEKEVGYQIDQAGMHYFQEEQLEEQEENSMEDQTVNVIYDANEPTKTAIEINETKSFGEIEEEESKESRDDKEEEEEEEEEEEDKNDTLDISIAEKSNFKGKKVSIISPEVEKALQTLDEVINMMRKCRLNTEAKAASCLIDEKPPDMEKDTEKNLSISKDTNVYPEVKLFANLSKKETTERGSDEPPRTSSNHSSRRLGSSNSLSKDVNHNKIVPASPEQKSLPSGPAEVNHTISSFIEHGMTQNLHSDQNSHDHVKQPISQHNSINDISEDAVERYVRNRKTRYWCFPGSPIRLKKGRS
ncbi:Mitotic checkpoint serine/threonine-protein kinase BUB1, putative isoform 1 [Cucumis melo var. makuwa]|uniref:Mitotic checkpoint serine/threonine-protein kinase BUB1, putative isoform 1 n=1 Tax=Cucumis melo var. makuwa TaxID=1194695 RepID=A0A5A7TKE7_CUCMM|nr:Mitotic checkpoint serine/threonine-protein kinase BUB1, putative isoform 1 [Cucumis melo var. makuwa]